MTETTRSMVDSALDYASQGFRVFPCEPAGKKPIIGNWPERATTDPDQVRAFWANRPNANIGIATGKESGIFVVDVDTKGNGPWNLSQLELQFGKLPITSKSITGSGGTHQLFRYPDNMQVRNRTGIVSGVDIRGEGGYIIAAPSLHQTGKEYTWAPGLSLDKVKPTVCPEYLLRLITSPTLKLVSQEADTPIRQGKRNSTLASMAGSMRRLGMKAEAIELALLEQNSSFLPPLPVDEVVGIVRSISRYEPAGKQFPHTELGNAERLVHHHGIDLHYYPHIKKWLVWDGIRWKTDQIGFVNRLVNDTVRRMIQEAYSIDDLDKRKELLKWQKTSESGKAGREILSHAKSLEGIPVVPEELDTNHWIFNVNNGEIDLKTGELLPHRRESLITKLAPVTYDQTATCPIWIAFLEKIMGGNKGMINFLQCAIGYALTGETREQCLFILHGNGSNGKSTFLTAISAMFGEDYSTNTPTQTFMARKGGGIPNDIAALKGARFVTAVEAERDQKLAEGMVKNSTGGDKVAGRYLFGEWFAYTPEFKLFLATNHKPQIKGTDNGIWRRIRLIPFVVTIAEAEKDKDLPEKLLSELPGILNWALDGCLQWQKDGLGVPDEVKAATEEYRAEMDVVEGFLDECCVRRKGSKVANKELFDAYKAYCISASEKPESQKGFSSRMKDLGFETPIRSAANGGYEWHGLDLIRETDDLTSLNDTASEAAGQYTQKSPSSTARQTSANTINLAESFSGKFDVTPSSSAISDEELKMMVDLL